MIDALALLDWRRRVGDLYAAIRGAAEPEASWTLWQRERDALFRDHTQTPLAAGARAELSGPGLLSLRSRAALSRRHDAGRDRGRAGLAGGRGWHGADAPIRPHGRAYRPFWRRADLVLDHGLWRRGVPALRGCHKRAGRRLAPGRYLLDTIKGADLGRDAAGRLVLDFNFAYFPSCAYSPRWVCPLAPEENRLAQHIRGGRKTVTDHPWDAVSGSISAFSVSTAPSQMA